jgi:hypothetical protein
MNFSSIASIFTGQIAVQPKRTFRATDAQPYQAKQFARSVAGADHCSSCGSGGEFNARLKARRQAGETNPFMDLLS